MGRAYGYGERPTVFATPEAARAVVPSDPKDLSGSPHKRTVKKMVVTDGEARCVPSEQSHVAVLPEAGHECWVRRFILTAEPQAGKTGLILWLLKLIKSSVVEGVVDGQL